MGSEDPQIRLVAETHPPLQPNRENPRLRQTRAPRKRRQQTIRSGAATRGDRQVSGQNAQDSLDSFVGHAARPVDPRTHDGVFAADFSRRVLGHHADAEEQAAVARGQNDLLEAGKCEPGLARADSEAAVAAGAEQQGEFRSNSLVNFQKLDNF